MKLTNLLLIASLLFAVACGSESSKSDDDDDKQDKDKKEMRREKKKRDRQTESIYDEYDEYDDYDDYDEYGYDDDDYDEPSTSSVSCDDFLNDYEAWVDEYIEVYQDMQRNPTDPAISGRYIEATQQMAAWSEKWVGLYDCADDPGYTRRLEKIQAKIDEAF